MEYCKRKKKERKEFFFAPIPSCQLAWIFNELHKKLQLPIVNYQGLHVDLEDISGEFAVFLFFFF